MIAAGAGEILYHDGKCWRETVRANVFFIANGEIFTPGEKILKGITRKQVIHLAAKNFKVNEADIPVAFIDDVSEIFITSSTKGVLPVVEVDGKKVGSGKPGPISTTLSTEWEKHVKAYIREKSSHLVG